MRHSNVHKFPSGKAGGVSPKVFAVIFYLFLGFMLTFVLGLGENGLWLILLLGLLYNFFVRGRLSFTAYFRRHPILLSLILLLLLLSFISVVVPTLLIAVLYWLMIGRNSREAPYFLRFHMLTALILNFLILFGFLLLNALVMLVNKILALAQLGPAVAPFFALCSQYVVLIVLGIFFGLAVWLSVSALMGRTPYIRMVTDNVRHWS